MTKDSTSPKIILISTAFPYRGGIAATTDRLAQEYIKRGADVQIWTYKMLYPKLIFPGKSQYHDLENHTAPKGVIIHRKINAINPFNWIKVGRQLKKARATKVIIRYWLPFLAPCLGTIVKFAKNNSTKFVGLIDNVSPHESRIGDKALSNYFYKKLDGFLVMAQGGVNELKESFKVEKPIIYSPHPLFDTYGAALTKSVAANNLNLDPTLNYILSFGLIRKYKGLDLLLKAFKPFSASNPTYRLIIAGECYDKWEEYQEIIDTLDLTDKIVRFDNFIPDEAVKNYFSIADFLALTYKSATQSGVTQIAYSMELPILVTNVGDLANMVPHDTVGRVSEVNIPAITENLFKMADKTSLARYKTGIREEKSRFEWAVLYDNLNSL